MQCRPPDRPHARPAAFLPAGSVTDDDRRQTMADDSQQNNSGPLGGPPIMLQRRCRSMIIVLWKETAFPVWIAMGKGLKTNVVFLVSSVIVVMRLPISCVSSMAMSCHVPCLYGSREG